MAIAILNNAIGWAQFRLLGAWKNTLLACGGYAVIFAALMFGFAHGMDQPTSTTFGYFAHIFLSLQVVVLLLYGLVRVSGAVRADVRSRMIESHRLMPFGAGSAVLGYLFGAPIQALGLFLINYLLGAFAVMGAGLPIQWWNIANGMLLVFAFFVWSVVLFFSFRTVLAMWAAIAAMVLIPFSAFQILMFAPGASVLVGPMIGNTIFDVRSGATFDGTYALSVAAQALIGGLYLFAATKRYQRDEVVAFGPLLSMILLAAWVAVCDVGTIFFDEFETHGFRRASFEDAFVTSMTLAFLLAVLPVSSGVLRAGSTSSGKWRRMFLPWMMIVTATLIVLGLVCSIPRPSNDATPVVQTPMAATALLASIQTALVAIAFLAGVRYVRGISLRTKLWPRLTLFGWLLMTWCLPLLIDVFVQQAITSDPSHEGSGRGIGGIGMLSPVAELNEIWGHQRSYRVTGFSDLLGPCVLSLVMAIIYHVFFARPKGKVGRLPSDANSSRLSHRGKETI